MRILTISNAYPPHFYGGYELTCADVMRRFVDAGHDVLVLTSTLRLPDAGPDESTVPVRRELSVGWDWDAGAPRRPRWPLRRWRDARADLDVLARALREHRPDVVSVWHFGALSVPLLVAVEDAGIPMVVTVANDWLIHVEELDPWARMFRVLPQRFRPALAGVATRLPQFTATTFNFVSAHTRARTAERTSYDVGSAPVVHPGIDTADFPIRTGRTDDGWNWRLLYVGRVTRDKGVGTLIRALAQLPAHASLDVIGDGEAAYIQELRRLAADLRVLDRLHFDRCARSDLAERYLAADVVVFPSEWDEPFGLVPVEAMACGVPVVATGTGGSAEFLSDGDNCVLFPPRDETALARCVRQLADDPELRRRLVRAGCTTASSLTADAYAQALLTLHLAAAGALEPRLGSLDPTEEHR